MNMLVTFAKGLEDCKNPITTYKLYTELLKCGAIWSTRESMVLLENCWAYYSKDIRNCTEILPLHGENIEGFALWLLEESRRGELCADRFKRSEDM
jgi:hypothetical protein